jgi:hypothetical protein
MAEGDDGLISVSSAYAMNGFNVSYCVANTLRAAGVE